MTRLLLASASPARRATLRAAGIEPLVLVSEVDEDAVLAAAGGLSPAEAVLVLARAKAEAVHAVLPDRHPRTHDLVLLGCDSMLELDGQVLGKPTDAADALSRWDAMRGRSGVLHTGHWLVDARAATARSGTASPAAPPRTAPAPAARRCGSPPAPPRPRAGTPPPPAAPPAAPAPAPPPVCRPG
ncbi:MAG: Maf family protein [Cellulomonas sp.]|nr:Maf family protein [Cellulomonas sp.]